MAMAMAMKNKTYMYVAADTNGHRYSKTVTLGKIINALMMASNGRVDVVGANSATGAWNGQTENSVRIEVVGNDEELVELAYKLCVVLGQESVMIVIECGNGGNADVEIDTWYAPLSEDNWTRLDGIGTSRFTYVPNESGTGEYQIEFVGGDGRITGIGE